MAASGSEEMYLPVCSNITVPNAGDSRVDFSLEKTGFGSISGDVFVDGAIDPDNPPVMYISFYRILPKLSVSIFYRYHNWFVFVAFTVYRS